MCQNCQQTNNCSSCNSTCGSGCGPVMMKPTCKVCDDFVVLNQCGQYMRLEGRYPIDLVLQGVDTKSSLLTVNLCMQEQEDTFTAVAAQASYTLTEARLPNFKVKIFVTDAGSTVKYKEGVDFSVLNNVISFTSAFAGGERVDILYFI